MSDEKRTPMWVRCMECSHVWIGMYMPMMVTDAARVMKRLTCPMCAASAKRITPSAPPAAASVARTEALAAFAEWFAKNYPGPDTIIHDPNWHAPRIFRAVESAQRAANQPFACPFPNCWERRPHVHAPGDATPLFDGRAADTTAHQPSDVRPVPESEKHVFWSPPDGRDECVQCHMPLMDERHRHWREARRSDTTADQPSEVPHTHEWETVEDGTDQKCACGAWLSDQENTADQPPAPHSIRCAKYAGAGQPWREDVACTCGAASTTTAPPDPDCECHIGCETPAACREQNRCLYAAGLKEG